MENPITIGIYDSGVGGFSVYSSLRNSTQVPIIYCGDCKYAPYGEKSDKEIKERIIAVLSILKKYGATHFISACNSISVNMTEDILIENNIPTSSYVDMISCVQELPCSSQEKVLLLGTEATLRTGMYQQIMKSKGVQYIQYFPKYLAYAIENGDHARVDEEVMNALVYAKKEGVTHILYACTHYPLVHDVFLKIASLIGYTVSTYNPGDVMGGVISHWSREGNRETKFLTTRTTEVFSSYAHRYGGNAILV